MIDAAVARGPVDDEPRVLEDLQVLGHRGATDGQLARELSDRARPFRETLEDRASRRVTEGSPGISLVSNH